MDADLYYYNYHPTTAPTTTTTPPPPFAHDVQSAVPHLSELDADRRQSAWERRGGNPPFRMQVVRRRRCEKRRRRYQHSEKIEVLQWLEDYRVPRRPFDSRFLREEDDIDDPDFRRPTVIEAAKYFDIPRESIMNWRKQRSRLLPSTPQAQTQLPVRVQVQIQPVSPPATPSPSPSVASMLNAGTNSSSSSPAPAESYERTRKMLSITSLCNANDSSDHRTPAALLLTPEPTPSPLIPTQHVYGLAPGNACVGGTLGAYSPYSPESTPSPYDSRY